MKPRLEWILAGMMVAGVSSASCAETMHHKSPAHHGSHLHRQIQTPIFGRASKPVRSADADDGLVASPDSIGSLFGGIGRAYDNGPTGYNAPLGFGRRLSAQVGSTLVGGGAAGDAYRDYLTHYYFYKYDYCPIGTKYVWYLRRCFGLGDLFR